MSILIDATSEKITVKKVPENQRLNFTPRLFQSRYLAGENAVYHFMRSFCAEYDGGFWEYYRTSNGSGFFKWDTDLPVLAMTFPQVSETMSVEAAGIAVTIFALSLVLEQSRSMRVAETLDALRDFAGQHPDSAAILRAID